MKKISALFISILLLTACSDDAKTSIKERFELACNEDIKRKLAPPLDDCIHETNITDEKKEEFIGTLEQLKKSEAQVKIIPVNVRFELACDDWKELKKQTKLDTSITDPNILEWANNNIGGACTNGNLNDEQKMEFIEREADARIARNNYINIITEGRAKGYEK